MPDVDLRIDCLPIISYALAHNRMSVVKRLTVANAGPELRGATVAVTISDDTGVLSQEFELLVDVPTGGEVVLDDLGVRLDGPAMYRVTDLRKGRIDASVRVAGEVIAETSAAVDVLPATHWVKAEPERLFLELLAAHVMPNSPEVTELLKDTSERLRAATGSPSLEGYQSGPDRVVEIAKAVYEALQSRRVRYAEPAAGWGVRGQKVRTPAEVLGDSVGTCLDTTVLFAGCLEQCGIRPLLWVVPGHAFCGYWLEEVDGGGIVTSDPKELVNFVDLGLMRLVETTALTDGRQHVGFDAASIAPVRSRLAGDLDDVHAVDVYLARHNDVFPIPARSTDEQGRAVVVEYRPAEHSRPPLVIQGGRQARPTAGSSNVPTRVVQWKNALLDLSLRNKLINFTPRHTVNLSVPSASLGTVEDLLNAQRPVSLLPADRMDDIVKARGVRYGRDLPEEARTALIEGRNAAVYCDVSEQSYQSRLRSLAYRARTIVEESGANNLYLALGTLSWTFDAKPLRSPLVLVPVTLVTRGRQSLYRIEIDEAGQSTPNFCLLEKLKQAVGLTLPGLADPATDGSGIDLDAVFTSVRRSIAEKGLDFRVEATADLAILQFAKFRLWKDLDENWEEFGKNGLVEHLTHRPAQPFPDSRDVQAGSADLDALAARCPIPADASQLTAVADAVSGRTFVLEGPPGTGKSQTITNMLVRAMAEGRRVLFVAEKRAALDVVKDRLDRVGMGPFALDLHDKGSKPVAVREQLLAAIEHSVGVDEQGLKARTDETTSAARQLTRYAHRLHETNGAGLSLYSATTQLLTLRSDAPSMVVPPRLLGDDATGRVETVRSLLRTLPEVADPARPSEHHPWAFVTVDGLDAPAVERVAGSARRVDAHLERLRRVAALGQVLDAVANTEQLEAVVGILRSPGVTLQTLDRTRSSEWRARSSSMRQEIHAFVAAAHPGLDQATPAALELPLADIHGMAQQAASSGWWGRKKRLRAVLAQLEPGLRPGHSVDLKELPALTGALVQLHGAVNHLGTRSRDLDGVSIPERWNPLTPEGERVVAAQLDWLEWAGSVVEERADPTGFTTALRAMMQSTSGIPAEAVDELEQLSGALREVLTATGADGSSVERWRGDVGALVRWERSAPMRSSTDPSLGSLVRWLELRRALAVLDEQGMGEARAAILDGRLTPDDAADAFERGLAEASVLERRLASGLDAFDGVSHEKSIQRFRHGLHGVQDILRDALPTQVAAGRAFDTEGQLGRIGLLRRELTKTRRGLGVRALMEQYGDLVTQLTPCVLVSPDSLARFFPPKAGLFDLVVFDEASQIRVADAIGAMGRATSVVVVGDSKQMPPTSFAEASLDVDAEEAEVDLVVADEESILTEAVQAGVPQHWLSWHYRSQDESLISFSNAHYYDGRLSSFPAPRHGAADAGVGGYGVALVRVAGEFHRSGRGKLLRTNPVEAEAIVADLRRRFDAAAGGDSPSVGVVTFNQQQRAYIEALIRDDLDQRMAEALDDRESEGLFVKNLENVQGDERDVILFSTAFGVNDKGVLPLNFGPLNRGGGERRLNVAVTRARRQVVVYSSFEPSQLRAEETSSVGIKHLRAYLDLAALGAETLASRASRSRAPDRHREQVADALRERGWAVRTDVGLSDFRVDLVVAPEDTPEQPVAAVLLDGPEWASRRTVGDRDGLPSDVLGGMMRWPVVARLWLPTWLDDPQAALDRLEEQLREPAAEAPSNGSVTDDLTGQHGATPESPDAPRSEAKDAVLRSFSGSGTPVDAPAPGRAAVIDGARFRAFETTWRGSKDQLNALEWSRSARTQVRDALLDVVETEGPVHEERAARLVAACFELTRLNAKRIASLLAQVPSDLRRGPEADVLWPGGLDPRSWGDHRRDPEAQRPIEHISLLEIANAMSTLARGSGGMSEQDVMRAGLAEFGLVRMTPGVTQRLTAALGLALDSGRLRREGDYVVAASSRAQ
ncbi:DUF4011 domain-containing protein [Phycicoccus sp. DTK01]|uniref:DUF3320 domain-containing protein n=1 Tax=Phycicoccus sp. DTK01 TaxID=2785745 RepID=UPI001A90A88D|nr:DUF4011 domain-containing protein [Phycicoccus sp. DTK01]GIL33984.1 DNA helicase [Phycicoccus sp. DTK01]